MSETENLSNSFGCGCLILLCAVCAIALAFCSVVFCIDRSPAHTNPPPLPAPTPKETPVSTWQTMGDV